MRPRVDVVVPFAGSPAELDATIARLSRLSLRAGDTLTIVDNGGIASRPDVLQAAEIRSSYYARNRGAREGTAPWIVFLDADVLPVSDLLDRYFEPEPAPATAILAGGIRDEDPEGRGLPVRYAALKRSMSHETVLAHGEWAFAQTANCAVRREAFEAAGGFVQDIRSGGDADLAYRLRQAGHELEVRAAAEIVHLNRPTWRGLLRQRAKHGSGAAWLGTRHPGAHPRRRKAGLAKWTLSSWGKAAALAARRQGDAALVAFADPIAVWAFELGRRSSNQAEIRRPPPE